MTFYDNLNSVMDYLEAHLDGELNYSVLARRAGVSLGTLQRLFPLFAGITLADYIRRRRLTLAGKDLAQTDARVIDIAVKYGYDSSVAFSRAFHKFHGIKPSAVKNTVIELKYYPKLTFTAPQFEPELEYEIVQLPAMRLLGCSIRTDNRHIKQDAPQFYCDIQQKYPDLPHPDYGMISYLDTRDSLENYEYWVLWRTPTIAQAQAKSTQSPYGALQPYRVAASRWLKICIPSQLARDIQEMSDRFYEKFLPTCHYRLRPTPELEYYHDGVTDFLIPIF